MTWITRAVLDQIILKRMFHFDTTTGIFIRLTGNKQWRGKRAGYISQNKPGRYYRRISITIDGKTREYYEHRLAYLYVVGIWPPHLIDHVDGDGTNNAWTNLRPATPSENQWNMRRAKNNKSGHIGVHLDRQTQKWRATMQRQSDTGRKRHIGRYARFEDAVAARIAAEDTDRRGIRFTGSASDGRRDKSGGLLTSGKPPVR